MERKVLSTDIWREYCGTSTFAGFIIRVFNNNFKWDIFCDQSQKIVKDSRRPDNVKENKIKFNK